jgi:type II secretory pathway pseudopilin PulG
MQNSNYLVSRERGISLIGLILSLAILGMIAVLGMKVAPTVVEFMSIKKAIVVAQKAGTTDREVRVSFDKAAEIGYFDAVAGKDLSIVRTGDGSMDVSFSYTKKIPLVGPASLLLEYEGTTAKSGAVAKKKSE